MLREVNTLEPTTYIHFEGPSFTIGINRTVILNENNSIQMYVWKDKYIANNSGSILALQSWMNNNLMQE